MIYRQGALRKLTSEFLFFLACWRLMKFWAFEIKEKQFLVGA